jgi:hypothetical protein
MDNHINTYSTMQSQSEKLITGKLGGVFRNTAASYKYYWMLSILQIFTKTEERRIDVRRILVRMVANAWYPVHYFKLSFGKVDSLFDIAVSLQRLTGIAVECSVDDVARQLYAKLSDKEVRGMVDVLGQNVTYRFLTPWISLRSYSDSEMVKRSQRFENGCLYAIHKTDSEFYIELNEDWTDFLKRNCAVIRDFVYWNLTLFVQKRNPNVPNVANKLIRPDHRSTLSRQRNCWNVALEKAGPMRCIYTGAELHAGAFDLDHFIPWSFVTHDLMWNLIPADSSINSSKSNRLPDLGIYLPAMAAMQQRMLRAVADEERAKDLLEDYLSLGCSAGDLIQMSGESFLDVYRKTFVPLNQIASNMGFETWKH